MQEEVKKFWENLKDKTKKVATKEEFVKLKKEFNEKKGEAGKLFKRVADVAHKEKKEIDKVVGKLKKEAVHFIEQQRKITGGLKGDKKKATPQKAAGKKSAAKKATTKKKPSPKKSASLKESSLD